MRIVHFMWIVVLMIVPGCGQSAAPVATTASAVAPSSATMYGWSRAPVIPAAKLAGIHDGMTVAEIEAVLGPHWMPPSEGIGIYYWYFDDGRWLKLYPKYGQMETTLIRWSPGFGDGAMWIERQGPERKE